MPKVLVLFHGRTGHTAALADAIAEGARSVRFTEVDVRRVDDPAPPDVNAAPPRHRPLADVAAVADYDALVLGGSGEDAGGMALRPFLDRLAPLAATGALADRVGAAFTAGPVSRDGHDAALLAILAPLGALGFILAPPGPAGPSHSHGGHPLGATTSAADGSPTADDLAAARHAGARVARIAGWVRHAKGHEAGHAHGHHHHH